MSKTPDRDRSGVIRLAPSDRIRTADTRFRMCIILDLVPRLSDGHRVVGCGVGEQGDVRERGVRVDSQGLSRQPLA